MTPEEKRALLKRAAEDDALQQEMTPEEKRALLKKQLLYGDIAPTEDVSMVGSMARGALRGSSYDLSDEAAGAIEAGRGVFRGEFSPSDISENYRAGRQKARELYQTDMEQNPIATGSGMVAGGVVSSAVPGLNLSGAARLGNYGQAAAAGALYGYGASESDNPLVQAEETAKGAVLGPLIQKGVEKLPGREALREALQKKAREKAVTASGAMTKQRRALKHSGMEDAQGEFLLRNKVVTPLASLEDIAERSKTIKESAGQRIGGIISKADDLRQRALMPILEMAQYGSGKDKAMAKVYAQKVQDEFGFGYQRVADRITKLMERDSDIASARSFHFPYLEKMRDVFMEMGTSGSLASGLRNKTNQRRLMKPVESLSEEYKQEIYDIISDELEQSVSKIPQLESGVSRLESMLRSKGAQTAKSSVPQIGDSGLGDLIPSSGLPKQGQTYASEAQDIVDQWRQANRDYAGAAVAERTAQDRLGTVQSNRDFGLTTSIAANAGLLAGGAPAGIAMGATNNFFRKYGSTLQAVGYDRLAQMLQSESPAAASKYLPLLRDGLKRGVNQFVLTNYLIAKQDPEYSTFLDRLMEGVQ